MSGVGATIETKKRVRFAGGELLDLSGRETIALTLAGGRTLVLATEPAVSPDGAFGDVVHLSRAEPPLAPAEAARARALLAEGYRLLATHLVLA
ncbi:MAG: hypothetical protein H6923_08995 [Alphaproteobacteria bacterium]|nr:hypothetical protein [Alphaproteobacteria bacterium]